MNLQKRLILLAVCFFVLLTIVACESDDSGVQEVTPLPRENGANTTEFTRTPTATSQPIVEEQGITPTIAINSAPAPTRTPLDTNLESGEAQAIAAATDTAYRPPVENAIIFEDFPVALTFDEFYSTFDMRRGYQMSDKLLSLDGQEVVIEGYIAPPLKPKLDFFVLTQIRLAFCPFCSTDADWPAQMALVYLEEAEILDLTLPVRVRGRLEVGSSLDAETGMVSLVRLYAYEIEELG